MRVLYPLGIFWRPLHESLPDSNLALVFIFRFVEWQTMRPGIFLQSLAISGMSTRQKVKPFRIPGVVFRQALEQLDGRLVTLERLVEFRVAQESSSPGLAGAGEI